jgi:hypothetical protein
MARIGVETAHGSPFLNRPGASLAQFGGWGEKGGDFAASPRPLDPERDSRHALRMAIRAAWNAES